MAGFRQVRERYGTALKVAHRGFQRGLRGLIVLIQLNEEWGNSVEDYTSPLSLQ